MKPWKDSVVREVQQNDSLSPSLFAVYTAYLEEKLAQAGGIAIGKHTKWDLAYADDIVLSISETRG